RRGWRPGRVASFTSPAIPAATYRSRQRVIVGVVVLSACMISPVGVPVPLRSTIFARRATFCGVLRPRASRSNAIRSDLGIVMRLLVLMPAVYHELKLLARHYTSSARLRCQSCPQWLPAEAWPVGGCVTTDPP